MAPDDAYALGTKGQVLLALGRKDEALAVLERSLRRSIGDSRGYTSRWARRLSTTIGTRKPLPPSTTHWRSSRKNLGAMATKGSALTALERYDEALATVDQVLGLVSNHLQYDDGRCMPGGGAAAVEPQLLR